MTEYLIVGAIAFLTGLIDSIVGGGGLISVPGLFSLYPNQVPATLLGTNKLGGIWGTATAAVNYSRVVKINWKVAIPAAVAALFFSFFGAYLVTQISPAFLRKILPFILIAVALYTFRRKHFGHSHQPLMSDQKASRWAAVTGAVIGLYDGFFGPGTGSFLIFIFVRFFGFDFLNASALAKIVNVATNLAALVLFGLKGNIVWPLGLLMALFNIGGSLIGSRLAIKHGSGFVRKLFLCIVCILIIKTFYDAYLH